jgi:hypothetical protein
MLRVVQQQLVRLCRVTSLHCATRLFSFRPFARICGRDPAILSLTLSLVDGAAHMDSSANGTSAEYFEELGYENR